MFIGIFYFSIFGKIGKKLHTNQSNAVIGGVMLNVVMWVHVSLNCKSFCGFLVHSLIHLDCWALIHSLWVYNTLMLEVAWTL
jgi:hypothetical protein